MKHSRLVFLAFALFYSCGTTKSQSTEATDPVAENMLLYQLDNGGWPQDHGDAINYEKQLDPEEKAVIIKDKAKERGTIDDRATTREISYLLKAYGEATNSGYLPAAERGIRFLLAAQTPTGGWPQEYPDPTGYHRHITYNDNAMINVLNLLKRVAAGKDNYAPVGAGLKKDAAAAVERGIECIVRSQVVSKDGQLTVWCAQHDAETLWPASARKFEPASLSGSESVEIIRFLMEIEDPSEAVKTSIRAGVAWLDQVRIDGYRIKTIADASQPKGKDRVLVPEEGYTSWARFYELDTYRPIFAGRDGVVRYDLKEVENERRMGYGFYGKWAKDLINKELDRWEERIK